MADEQDAEALLRVLNSFHVNFCDQRTGGIDDAEAAGLAGVADFRGNAVSGVDDTLAIGNLVDAIDKNSALAGKLVDDVAVVHDLFADVDRGAKGVQCDADDIDGTNYAGAKATRLQ